MNILWFSGYVTLRINPLFSERFFNLCMNRGIEIRNLMIEEQGYHFQVALKDFYELRPLVRKIHPELKLEKKTGFPFVLHTVLQHKAYIAGAVFFMVTLFLLHLFVWNITIQGNSYYSSSQLYAYLETQGIYYGCSKEKIDCEVLEASMRRDFDNIIWVSAALRGTKLSIDIRENMDEQIQVPEGVPSNILADRDGIVASIIVRTGQPIAKIGDAVVKGDILISGIVVTLNEAYEPIKEDYVYADGDVYLYIQIPYTESLKRAYVKKAYTGHSYKSVNLQVLGKAVKVNPYKEKYEYYEDFTRNWMLCLYQDFYLPFETTTTYRYEYTLTEENYTDEEMNQILTENFHIYLKNLEEKGIQIIENNVKITVNEDEAQIYGFIYAIEKTEYREAITDEYN